MTFRRFAVALSFVASFAVAQEQVTRVDVVVTDPKGKPVRGLTAADFEVVTGGQVSAVASVAEPATPAPRRVLVVFDNVSLTMAHRRQMVSALRNWIDAHVRANDRVAVAALNPSLRQVLDWSSDKAAIVAALDTASRDAGSHGEQERRRSERLISDVIQRAAETDERSPIRPSFDEIMGAGRNYASAQLRDTDSLLSALGAAMTWFTHPTDKRILLVAGESLPRNPGYDMFTHLHNVKMQIETNGPALLVDGARRSSPLTEARRYDIVENLVVFRNSAIARGVIVYAVNPGRGEDTGGTVEEVRPTEQNIGFVRAATAMTGYDFIAGPTGGMAFSGVPVDRALAQVASDLGAYYSLTYNSAGASTVRTKRGHRVRTTLGAVPMGPDERMRTAVLSLHATPPDSNELAISVAAETPREAGAERLVPLKVFIPISKLKIDPDGGEMAGAFSVYIATGNGHGGLSRVLKRTHEFRWPSTVLQYGQDKKMTFFIDVALPSGFNAISVGVLDQRSEKTGFERVAVR